MHGKRTLKTTFKVGFMIFQAALFLAGVCLLLAALVLYARGRRVLGLGAKVPAYAAILCALLVASAAAGFAAVGTRGRRLIGLYFLLLLTLVNMEALLLTKFPALTENARRTSRGLWERIDGRQRAALAERLGCCGFEAGDGGDCGGRPPCAEALQKVARGARGAAERALILLIFGESLSAGLLCLLKLRK